MVEDIRKATGLREGVRHPLSFLMEACDDIAYSVLDIEDAVKKGLVSTADVLWSLKEGAGLEPDKKKRNTLLSLHNNAERDFKSYRKELLTPIELNDLSMQKFRVHAIECMMHSIVDAFKNNIGHIMEATYICELLDCSCAGAVALELKKFARKHVYRHRSVLEVELQGYRTKALSLCVRGHEML